MPEITLNELSAVTGLSLSHLTQLIKREILPKGRKDGRTRYLPKMEALNIIKNHEQNKHWKGSSGNKASAKLQRPAEQKPPKKELLERESVAMPTTKDEKPLYYLVKKGNDYHVYRNDEPNGTPTGKIAANFEEGQKIIRLLEDEHRTKVQPQPTKSSDSPSNKSDTQQLNLSVLALPKDSKSSAPSSTKAPVKSKLPPSLPTSKVRKMETILRNCSPENADKAKRLFQFLRELTLLRSKTIRTLDEYTNVIWFEDFPNAANCFSVFRVPEDERSELLLEIEQPIIKSPPTPQDDLAKWVNYDQLKFSSLERPELMSTITALKNTEPDSDESRVQFERIEDYPDVQLKWEDYISKHWNPWAEQDRSDQIVLNAYEEIFDIYQTMQKLAENYELLLGVGLLTWKTPSQQTVCRHLLTARANITFDATHGMLAITAPPEGTKFQLEQDMLELSERPANHHRKELDDLLDQVNENPWSHDLLNTFLQTWLNAASPRGAYNAQDIPNLDAADDPQVTFAPAIIFRQRTERNMVRLFEEIIQNIDETGQLPLGVERLVSIVDDADFDSADGTHDELVDDEIYFPLAANADQREIAEKLRTRQGVLVQGPPGTGKSHTIANLVCHLLATGKRILVTSHTPRALTVLRDKFADDMKALCVSVIGDDGTATRKALEESVSGITSKRNNYNESSNQRLINELNTSLDELRQSEAWTRNALRAIRESDTYCHPVKFESYSGTTQAIAQRVAAEHPKYCWLNVALEETDEPPLSNEEALDLLVLFRTLSAQRIEDIQRPAITPDELPSPDQFTEWVAQYQSLIELSAKLTQLKTHPAFVASSKLTQPEREKLSSGLGEFVNMLQRILNRRESWVKRAATEIVSDRDRSWRQLLSITRKHLKEMGTDHASLVSTSVVGLGNKDLQLVRAHAAALLTHIQNKGLLGIGPFRPRPVRDALYLINETHIDGKLCNNVKTLVSLLYWLDINSSLETLKSIWKGIGDLNDGNMVVQIAEIEDWCEPLEDSLKLHDKMVELRESLQRYPGLTAPQWDDLDQVALFAEVLSAGHIEERLQYISSELESLLTKAKSSASHPNSHRAVRQLQNSIETYDHELYHSVYRELSTLAQDRASLQRREALVNNLTNVAPSIASMIEQNCDDICWDDRMSSFVMAWNWARASTWVQRLSKPDAQQELSEQLEISQSGIRKTLGQLAAAKAWRHTFDRLTEGEHSHLIAWELAMRRIGKGTGKYAEKHRRDARKHMEECRSAIPAWIMPMHKVVETTRLGGEPFDVVIVDEASQSGPEALFLMYIAKQIIVVGDDKQISPDFVGLNRQNVDVLRDQFLKDVPFSDALGVDHSFFDQAKIRYRGTIRLKEHFRCMPEIIQFSNGLCYADDPLIPLRQYGAGRLTPVIQTRYIQSGYCDEESRKTVNIPEAEAIIEQIKQCCADPAYDGKTIGVISLLNTSGQAEYIEKRFKLGTVISKEEMDKRKFRVGDSYVFQGDERDIIFLSMVSAPRPDGKRLWPMTTQKDERRFNVAASRARDQVWLYHSVALADINPNCVRFKLLDYYTNPKVTTTTIGDYNVEALRRRLESAYSGTATIPKPFDSWFEVDVFLRIVSRGYRVIPQYSMNGYYIDLVVEGMKGRLAVECDGDTWHGADQYENDVARQRDLERCGMQFWRVRGSAFYLNPEKSLEDLWVTLEKMKIYPSTASSNTTVTSSITEHQRADS